MLNYNGISSGFHNSMQQVFGPLNWLPSADGKIHRFHIVGDRRDSQNGWYVFFENGFGRFGSWKSGHSYRYSNPYGISRIDSLLICQSADRSSYEKLAERSKREEDAIRYANYLWNISKSADPFHPYLISKDCKPHGLRQNCNALLVPIFFEGKLVNIQRISPRGEKRFILGGRLKSCYSKIGTPSPDHPMYLCEGWATGATLHEETGAAVACAMSSGNLLSAGLQLKYHHPDVTIIMAGDDDRQKNANTGRVAASNAALALRCGLVLPNWPDEAPTSLSDFNDLRSWLRVKQ